MTPSSNAQFQLFLLIAIVGARRRFPLLLMTNTPSSEHTAQQAIFHFPPARPVPIPIENDENNHNKNCMHFGLTTRIVNYAGNMGLWIAILHYHRLGYLAFSRGTKNRRRRTLYKKYTLNVGCEKNVWWIEPTQKQFRISSPRLISSLMNELLRSDMIRGTGNIACQMENSMMVKLQFPCIQAR